MKDWKRVVIGLDTTIRESIDVIDKNATKIALIAGEDFRLLGTLTDGDIRRGLLRGIGLDAPVKLVYNSSPVFGSVTDDILAVRRIMRKNHVEQLPIIDHERRIVRLELMGGVGEGVERNNSVVLMAGGMGTRLLPLTETCPKPLLKVRGKAILQIILENFIEYGFRDFYISVHYKADMIEKHFGDGSDFGVSIKYLREQEMLGTAGALSLIEERHTDPLIVMNGDLLTNVNFHQLMEFHTECKTKATICVTEYGFQVPYGVVRVDNQKFRGLEEKPLQKFFVNAGIYVLESELLNLIPKRQRFDIIMLFEDLVRQGREIAVFPIRECWMDIGQVKDFEVANGVKAE